MTNSFSDNDRLRAEVRQQVIEALRRLEQPYRAVQQPAAPAVASAIETASSGQAIPANPKKQLIALFMAREELSTDLLAQIDSLARQGFRFCAAFSHSFCQFNDPEALLSRLPKATVSLAGLNERQLLDAVSASVGLVANTLSVNSAAKLAAGIDDSVPAFLLSQMLLAGKPVFVGRELAAFGPQLEARHASVPPAFRRTAEDHFHKVQQLGVNFVAAAHVASAVISEFTEFKNETPERLAKQRPSPKRQFITYEDVWQVVSRGHKELVHGREAIITDQARDYAAAQGVALRSE